MLGRAALRHQVERPSIGQERAQQDYRQPVLPQDQTHPRRDTQVVALATLRRPSNVALPRSVPATALRRCGETLRRNQNGDPLGQGLSNAAEDGLAAGYIGGMISRSVDSSSLRAATRGLSQYAKAAYEFGKGLLGSVGGLIGSSALDAAQDPDGPDMDSSTDPDVESDSERD